MVHCACQTSTARCWKSILLLDVHGVWVLVNSVFDESLAEAQERQIHRPWLPAMRARAMRSISGLRLLSAGPLSPLLASLGISADAEDAPDPPVQPYAAILIPSAQPVRSAPRSDAASATDDAAADDMELDDDPAEMDVEIIDAESAADLHQLRQSSPGEAHHSVGAAHAVRSGARANVTSHSTVNDDIQEGIDPDYRKNAMRFRLMVRRWRLHAQSIRSAFSRRAAAGGAGAGAPGLDGRTTVSSASSEQSGALSSPAGTHGTSAIDLIAQFIDPAAMTPCDGSDATNSDIPIPEGSLIQSKIC